MKVYLKPTTTSRGIMRVYDALVKYAPSSIEITENASDADITVFHVWGRHTTTFKQIAALRASGRRYAMIQYALRSTMRPDSKDWLSMWLNSELVWSYYDLLKLLKEDGMYFYKPQAWFYHAPLGVDPDVFYTRYKNRLRDLHIILASSQNYLSESAKECVVASRNLNKSMIFIGPELNRGSDVICVSGINDRELAAYYSQCVFVSGLRRTEGFELPVIEGLMCGARPIVFDRPEMREWFHDLAIFIPEQPREMVIESLEKIFKKGAKPVTEAEKAIALRRFDWGTIIKGFWDRLVLKS